MRILHVDSARGWRGGQNQVLLTAKGQAARGHAVVVAAQAGGVLEGRARAADLNVQPLRFHGDLGPGATIGLALLARRLRPEVIQAHDPHALMAAVLATRLPVVATRRVDFGLRGAFSRWKYRAARRVIAVSRAIVDVLRADGLPAAAITLVHEGVPSRPPAPGGAAALAALGIPPGAPVVGNVAALTDHKDHPTFLKAAAAVHRAQPEVRFLVVGEGERRAEMEALAGALGLSGCCTFAGFRHDLDALIPAFTVFCLSSHLEGLGTSLLDAMCFARPVVATAAGGIPDAVEDGVTGRLVPVRDADALAGALLEILRAPDRARQMGESGRRRFEERFTDARMVEETLRVYETIGA